MSWLLPADCHQSHNSYHPRSVKTSMCFLWDTWSQPPYFFKLLLSHSEDCVNCPLLHTWPHRCLLLASHTPSLPLREYVQCCSLGLTMSWTQNVITSKNIRVLVSESLSVWVKKRKRVVQNYTKVACKVKWSDLRDFHGFQSSWFLSRAVWVSKGQINEVSVISSSGRISCIHIWQNLILTNSRSLIILKVLINY